MLIILSKITALSHLAHAACAYINSKDQAQFDANSWLNTKRYLRDQRQRSQVSYNDSKAIFSQIYFGGSLQKFTYKQV